MALAMPSTPQPCVLDTCGQRWVPVFVDCTCAPQMVCGHACPHRHLCQNQAKGPLPEPGGKGLQSGDTSPIYTGPVLSHSHWMDSALRMKLLTGKSPRASSCNSQHPCWRTGEGVRPSFLRTWPAQTREWNELQRRSPGRLRVTDGCEASVLSHSAHWWGMQPKGTKRDKPRDSWDMPPWEHSGTLSRGGGWSWAKEMLEGSRGTSTAHLPLLSWPL